LMPKSFASSERIWYLWTNSCHKTKVRVKNIHF
jgi:hypothetical protein